MEITLERLAEGIRRANANGDTEAVKKLGVAYRELQAKTSQPSGGTPEDKSISGAFNGLGAAFTQSLDAPLEAMGETAEALGFEGVGGVLRGAVEQDKNYRSASEQFINGEDGYNWSFLPKAAVEQAGQFAGSILSRAGGAAAGTALAGPVGAAIGAIAGPAAFEAVQILGPVANERARNNGRDEPSSEDWMWALSTAGASGALNAIAPGASGKIARMGLEGATETGQAFVQQGGETLNTEKGLSLSAKEAFGEGILGATSAGAVDTSVDALRAIPEAPQRVANAIAGVRLDKDADGRAFDEFDAGAVQELLKSADGNINLLGNVDSTGQGFAQGAAKNAHDRVKRTLQDRIGTLKTYVKETVKDPVEAKRLKDVISNAKTGNLKDGIPDNVIQDLRDNFPDIVEAQEAADMLERLKRLRPFTETLGDIGGLGQYTRRLDVTDRRNSGMALMGAGALGIGAGYGSGVTGAATALATGFGVNRIARQLDKMTNKRSNIKRYVDSVQAAGVKAPKVSGQQAGSILKGLKDQQRADTLINRYVDGQEKEYLRTLKEDQKANDKLAEDEAKYVARFNQSLASEAEPTLDQSKGRPKAPKGSARKSSYDPDRADQSRLLRRKATEPYFEGGQELDPTDPTLEGYRIWKRETGMEPQAIYEALEDLEIEGEIPDGTASRFREDIQSFSGKKGDAAALQRIVKQRYQPDYQPDRTPPQGDKPLRKLEAIEGGLTSSRGKQKAREGDRRYRNVVAEVERAKGNLKYDQYQKLIDLADTINSPGVTRAERFEMLDAVLPTVFRNRVARDFWRKEFAPLASIGNDYKIDRVAQDPEAEPANDVVVFEQKVEEVRKARNKKKSKKTAETKTQPVVDDKPKTKAERALATLDQSNVKPTQLSFDFDQAPSTAVKAEEATTVNPEKLSETPATKKPRKEGKNSLRDMVQNRIDSQRLAEAIAENEAPRYQEYRNGLGKSAMDRVEGLIYDFANDRVTQNMLTDAYADRFEVPPEQAAKSVDAALRQMEEMGDVKRFQRRGQTRQIVDEKFIKDQSGQTTQVVEVEVTNPVMSEMLTIAKSINQALKAVPQETPDVQYDPNNLRNGPFRAFKDYSDEEIDGSFKPAFDFSNDLRNQKLAYAPKLVEQITEALEGTGTKKVGEIRRQLQEGGGIFTAAQIMKHLEDTDGDHRFRQEWTFGANLRIYPKNGSASTQGGDLMKALTRFPEKRPLGGRDGLNDVLHQIGNIMGSDKEAPADRRAVLFQKGTITNLLSFAKAPFREGILKNSKGDVTKIGQMIDKGEGFFQVLNVANEVADMVAFARERNKDKAKLSDEQLLLDPKVLEDIAQNYTTDFIVQLDAANNAYQLAGLTMGDETLLASTGLRPQEGKDPDTTKGADIYVAPAMAVVERIPALSIIPEGKIRKLFKNAIGTLLYEAEFASRKQSFEKELQKIAGDVPMFGTEGNPGLINVPPGIEQNILSEEGHTFEQQHYDQYGAEKSTVRARKRVVEEDGKFYVEMARGTGAWKRVKKPAESADQAVTMVYQGDTIARMNRELVREMNARYPSLRDYLNFARTLSTFAKGEGRNFVNIPTPDGMVLKTRFKDEFQYDSIPTEVNGRVVPLGFKTNESKLTGRGVAAFMMHQLDAYVLRETHRRMKAEGLLELGFNPIHDSFGFHPSEAKRGREIWSEVMQELGNKDYNIFVSILQENGLTPKQFIEMGGTIPNRSHVSPVPAANIPTALS